MKARELQELLLKRYGTEKFTPGLDRVRSVLERELKSLLDLNPTIITIAGTNGKGETALSLAALARQSGVPFVLWTSPHILTVTERLQTGEGAIGEAELSSLIEQVEEARMAQGVGLSYYEALWAAFVRWGLQKQAPLWILEVGLGGRLDAVNMLSASVVVLTSISRDHQEFLGPTYRSILHEKLGVLRQGATLVSALELRYLRELTGGGLPENVDWLDLFQSGELQLTDDYSYRNRYLALRVWQKLGHPQTSLPDRIFQARGEVWCWKKWRFHFYGSHNPDGMRKMVQFLQTPSYNGEKECFQQIWVAFSQRAVADVKAMVRMVESLGFATCFTRFEHPKANDGIGWWKEDGDPSSRYVHEWRDLLQQLETHHEGNILLLGSYYFVAAVQEHLSGLGAYPSPQSGTSS